MPTNRLPLPSRIYYCCTIPRNAFASIDDETQRNNKMNELVNRSGVEPGFTSGKTAADVEKSLLRRIDTLLLTYQSAKKLNRLNDFIRSLAEGDGCLTVRIGRVAEFQAELMGFGAIKNIASKEEINLMPITALSDFIQAKVFEKEMQSKALKKEFSTEEEVQNFSINPETQMEELTNNFKKFEKANSAKHFLNYLHDEGIIEDISDVNWQAVLPKLMNHADFPQWLSQGKADALQQLSF